MPPSAPSTAAVAASWNPTVTRWLLLAHFATFGVVIGLKGVVWAEVFRAFPLGEGLFGSLQLLPSVISMALLLHYHRLAHWFHPRPLIIMGLLGLGLAMLVLASTRSLLGLVISLALFGMGTGLMDGAMTQGSIDWEQATGQRTQNLLHAGFSGGAVAGAFGAGALQALSWSYTQTLLLAGMLASLAAFASLPLRYPPRRTLRAAMQRSAWREVLAMPALRGLMLILWLSIIVESIAFLWAVIYLRDELNATALVGGIGFALFNAAMFGGRLLNTPLVARHGPRASLLLSGAGLALAAMLLLGTATPALAILGLTLLGLAVAGIFPTVVGQAGELLPGRSEALTTVLMSGVYLGFLLTPPLTGWVAELSSLRAALVILLLCGLGVLWLARGLPGQQAQEQG